MTLVLGIDPDTTATGIALADADRVWAVGVCRVPRQEAGTRLSVEQRVARMTVSLGPCLASMLARCDYPEGMSTPELVVVEGQDLYLHSGVDPKAIVHLAQVAGSALGVAAFISASCVRVPKPKVWKGDVPKAIHQARVLNHYGISWVKRSDYVVPLWGALGPWGLGKIKKGDWKHVVDAIGLARWGATDPAVQRDLARRL